LGTVLKFTSRWSHASSKKFIFKLIFPKIQDDFEVGTYKIIVLFTFIGAKQSFFDLKRRI